MDVPELEIDPNFEPQTRARSNTWPAIRREDAVPSAENTPGDQPVSVTVTDESGDCKEPIANSPSSTTAVQQKTKGSSRRNAWGNLSYADLITKAIQSSPEQRLTLSQIYDWMVQNVPYFKDKGDSNSSAGWKNSIRHNLSLHNRFMRIQNEGTGKSSWWILNPDAKPGKSPRRRATSMDTKTYEKKRGRVKKKVEAMRAALEGNHSSPTSTLSDSAGDLLETSALHSFQLSPDFRPRTSSNASSCGRLSPIHSTMEPDLHDNQVPSISPIPWQNELTSRTSLGTPYSSVTDQFTDHLTDSLADIVKLADCTVIDDCNLIDSNAARATNSCSPTSIPQPHILQQQTSRNIASQFDNSCYNRTNSPYAGLQQDYDNSFALPPPPPYPNQINCSPPRQMINMAGGTCTMTSSATAGNMGMVNLMDDTDLTMIDSGDMEIQDDGGATCLNNVPVSMNQQQMLNNATLIRRDQRLQQLQALRSQLTAARHNISLLSGPPDSSILRTALTTQKMAALQQQTVLNMDNQQFTMLPTTTGQPQQLQQQVSQQQQQQINYSSGIPQDLDFSLDTFEDFDCDIDQVIKHELNVEGSLNCEFDSIGQSSNGLVH
ncbi:uncharacterized protein LOC141915324 [Tubulanus polymorphus]|uniref:uncharacterized protein LOC141915324 n=1 Tax=Tubulanus polymorphus TaxID=672921 RepID=UPI003DA1EDC7